MQANHTNKGYGNTVYFENEDTKSIVPWILWSWNERFTYIYSGLIVQFAQTPIPIPTHTLCIYTEMKNPISNTCSWNRHGASNYIKSHLSNIQTHKECFLLIESVPTSMINGLLIPQEKHCLQDFWFSSVGPFNYALWCHSVSFTNTLTDKWQIHKIK